jgi:hypothetical protein
VTTTTGIARKARASKGSNQRLRFLSTP